MSILQQVKEVAFAHAAMISALRVGDIETGMQNERHVMLHLGGLNWRALAAGVRLAETLESVFGGERKLERVLGSDLKEALEDYIAAKNATEKKGG